MDMQSYIAELKLKLTGSGILDCELNDSQLEQIVNSAFREVQRYIDSTKIATIPYSPCIDLSKWPISAVVRVFRAKSNFTPSAEANEKGMTVDPMYATQWQMLSGLGNIYGLQDFTYNVGSWNVANQIRNTLSTDLVFRYDKYTSKLYINSAYNTPKYITIEYVPRFDDVSQIVSDYWIDIICRLSLAITKTVLGRIRSKFTQTNALMQLDGTTLLEEGNAELEALREKLEASSQLCYPLD